MQVVFKKPDLWILDKSIGIGSHKLWSWIDIIIEEYDIFSQALLQ